MKFRSRTAEYAAITLASALAIAGFSLAFRAFNGHWPALGFWLGSVFVFFAVTIPAVRRGRKAAEENCRI